MDGWTAYLTLKFFRCEKISFKNIFFLNVFSYQGESFLKNFWCQRGKNRARRSKMDPKIDTFGQVDIRVLAILGVEKVDFWTFPKLFWSCLGSVRALFLTSKGQLLGVF